MELGEIISLYRKECGMTLDELSEKSGVPKGTINKIIGGVTKAPTLDNVKAIAHALGKRLADFEDGEQETNIISFTEQKMIKKYRTLDEHGKNMVDIVLDEEYKHTLKAQKEAEEREEERIVIHYPVPEYSEPVSAGTGNPMDTPYADNINLIKEPPRGTSFIAHITGDSMEPTFQDGDMIFVHAQNEIRKGQIGVFFMNGREYVKELGNGELISHNSDYDPIPFMEDIECQGLVLGVCDESYLEDE